MHPNLLFWRHKWFFFWGRTHPLDHTQPRRRSRCIAPPSWNPKYATVFINGSSCTVVYFSLTSKLPYTTFAKLFRDKCPRMCRNCLGKFSNRQDTTHFHGTLLAPTNRNRFPRNILWTTSRIVRFLSCIMQIKNLQDAVYLKLYKPKL